MRPALNETTELIGRRYTGVKVTFYRYPLGKNLRSDKRYTKEIRDHIGYDVDLAFSEGAPNRGVACAIRIAKAFDEFYVFFWSS